MKFELDEELDIRYNLCMERIKEFTVCPDVPERYMEYFKKCCEECLVINDITTAVRKNEYREKNLDHLETVNSHIYANISKNAYENSYADPKFSTAKCGEYGGLFSHLYMRIKGAQRLAIMNRFFDVVTTLELFNEVYNIFVYEGEPGENKIRKAVYDFVFDYLYDKTEIGTKLSLTSKNTFYKDIIMNEDISKPNYLYYFGEYVGPNERGVWKYLANASEDQIDKMASTFVGGYVEGFRVQRIDLSLKKTVQIRYNLGFERVIRKALKLFEMHGLEPAFIVSSTDYNPQLKFDHLQDEALYIDKAMYSRMLETQERVFESLKNDLKVFAGPAVMEVFGEVPFEPERSENAPRFDEKQQRLNVEFINNKAMLLNNYIDHSNTSFTIIAFPIPEIGKDFEAIFDDVIKVNTLDNEKYKNIQQCIVDALDKGDHVEIKGRNGNKTDIKVKLIDIEDPLEKTKFENCTADVNIPVGEVFTSPQLKGTEGILHVKRVYLKGLNYKDLTLEFKDGKISDYICNNFSDEKECRRFIKDNLLMNHTTLPMGEFAIGTNTTAYVMAKKYNITDKLPILIMEKTGPHFAIGDTCYSRAEDRAVFNPDGKEIVARDNEISILRKTEPEKAYFNCHTDVTIPYDELDTIIVFPQNGDPVEIIKEGRFCLKGTEELNKVF